MAWKAFGNQGAIVEKVKSKKIWGVVIIFCNAQTSIRRTKMQTINKWDMYQHKKQNYLRGMIRVSKELELDE